MKKILWLIIVLSIISGCSNQNKNQEIPMDKVIDQNISYIQSADLLVTGDFDFGTVAQNVLNSKIITIKNTGLTAGKVKIDLTTIFQTNGIFSINYTSSDCFVSGSYKILQPQYSCQIELLLNSGTSSGAIFAAIPLYDELAANALIKNLQANVVISSAGSIPPVGKSCITAYHKDPITNKCISDYKDCTSLISNSVIAKKHWNSTTSSFDACLATSCVPNYSPNNGGASCALTEPTATVTINTPSIINISNKSNYTISGTCSLNGNNVIFTIGSITSSAICLNLIWTKIIDVSLALDSTALLITATHSGLSGNTATKSTNVLKDTIAPILTTTNSMIYSNGTQITLLGSCEGVLPLSFLEINNTQNSGIICNNGIYSKNYNVVSVSDGVKTITINETDLAGNQSTINIPYTLDKTAPILSLNLLTAITATNVTSYSISGSCSENGQNVSIQTVDSKLNSLNFNALCSANIYSINLNLTTLVNGQVNFNLALTDLASNTTNLTASTSNTSAALTGLLSVLTPSSISTMVAPVDMVLSPDGNNAYVVNTSSNNVTQYSRNSISGQLSQIGTPLTVGSNPSRIIISPDGLSVYITVGSNFVYSIYQFSRNSITGLLTPMSPATLNNAYGTRCNDMTISGDGKHLYAIFQNSGWLQLYNRNTITGALTYVSVNGNIGYSPTTIVVSPDGNNVYVNDDAGGVSYQYVKQYSRNSITGELTSVTSYSLDSGSTGGYKHGMIIDSTGKFIYVLYEAGGSVNLYLAQYSRNQTSGNLTLIGSILNLYPTNASNYAHNIHISPDGGTLYFIGANNILGYSRNITSGIISNAIQQTISIPTNVTNSSITISPDSAFLYTTTFSSDFISNGAIFQYKRN